MPRRRPLKVRLASLIVALLIVPLAACSGTADDGRPTVVASFYPLQFLVKEIAGDTVRVVNLTQPGTEPHDLDPTVRQVAEISGADLVVYEKGLAPPVDKAARNNAGNHSLDVTPYVDLKDDNPHFWLDPLRFEQAAVAIEKRLVAIDPKHAVEFETNLDRLATRLEDIDEAYTAGLRHCARRTVVTSHDAFGYQSRYGLTFTPIAGLTPDAEPSPAKIGELQKLIEKDHITTVFSETIASPKMADTLAHDLGISAQVLDPIEGIAPGSKDDYVSLMRSNLAHLEKANGCTHS